ncbi:MAG: hypothetical protein BBJ57_13330 [Desulfobacterales bacterium PC51MH44]|nr:MAG: hypothetical protein BBJ57_13330 [Desulfobacterales bacterium PC51MH44]
MRVAIIEPVGGHRGMNYYDFGLAGGLAAGGLKATVYTSDRTVVPIGVPFQVKCSFKKVWGDTPKFLRAARFIACLVYSLLDARRMRAIIVHYHFFHYSFLELLCVTLARALGFRIVITAHDVESFGDSNSFTSAAKILSRADRVIAHNEVSKKELISRINLSPSRLAVIPHGNYLDWIPNHIEPSEARRRLGLPLDFPILLFFGQIKAVKGLDVLLQALPQTVARFPKLKLVVAGKVWKDDFSKYEAFIRENNLEKNVILNIRYIPDDEVALFFRSADLVILPYRKIYQSGVLLMAMSYDVPVMVSDLAGMVEIVKDGQNGFVFRCGDAHSLGESLIAALADPRHRGRVTSAGYETVVRNHGWNRIGRLTVELYRSLGA